MAEGRSEQPSARRVAGRMRPRQSGDGAGEQRDGATGDGDEGTDAGSPSAPQGFLPKLRNGAGVAFLAVLTFLGGTVLEPLTTRYLPVIAAYTDSWFDPLQVSSRWPVQGGCDPDTRVAMPLGGPAPDALPYSLVEDTRITAVANGAASWNVGLLDLQIRTREDAPVLIEHLGVVMLNRDDGFVPSWVLDTGEGGCGGGPGETELATYLLDLDRGILVDRTGHIDREADTDLPPADFRGTRVTAEEPLQIPVEVRSCDRFYRWQIVLTYTVGTTTRTRVLGPWDSAGGAAGVPIHEIEPGTGDPARRIIRGPDVTTEECTE